MFRCSPSVIPRLPRCSLSCWSGGPGGVFTSSGVYCQGSGHAAARHPETMKIGRVSPTLSVAFALDEGRLLLGALSPQSSVAWTSPRTRNCRPRSSGEHAG